MKKQGMGRLRHSVLVNVSYEVVFGLCIMCANSNFMCANCAKQSDMCANLFYETLFDGAKNPGIDIARLAWLLEAETSNRC
jgi:hypothetical protein